MRVQILIILNFFFASCLFGQQLSYKGLLVDSLLITTYSQKYTYHPPIDKQPKLKRRSDYYSIEFNKEKKNYQVANNKRIFNEIILDFRKGDVNLVESKKKERKNKNNIGKVICHEDIDSLINAFTLKYKQPSNTNLGIDSVMLLNYITENKFDENYHWCDAQCYRAKFYTNDEEKKAIINDCRNLDTFNVYLKIMFDTTGFIVSDGDEDEICFNIFASGEVFFYVGKYPNAFKQPWYNYSDMSDGLPAPIFNLDINKYLARILPEEFPIKKKLEISGLFDDYIKWYLMYFKWNDEW